MASKKKEVTEVEAKVEEKVETKVEEKTKADQVWDKIRGLSIDLYAIPDQVVEGHCKRYKVLPDVVHVKLKSTAVLPALEESLRKVRLPKNEMFDISSAGPYTIISIVQKLV